MVVNPLETSLTDFIKPCEKLTDYIKVYDDICDDTICDPIESFEAEEDNQIYIDRSQRPTFTEMNISQQYMKKIILGCYSKTSSIQAFVEMYQLDIWMSWI